MTMKNKIIFSTLIALAFITRAQNITYDHDATVTGAIETIVRSWGNTRIPSPLPVPIPAIYKPDLQGPVSQSTSSYICQH